MNRLLDHSSLPATFNVIISLRRGAFLCVLSLALLATHKPASNYEQTCWHPKGLLHKTSYNRLHGLHGLGHDVIEAGSDRALT